jgi:L-amino acid N-acyltransferase YncA
VPCGPGRSRGWEGRKEEHRIAALVRVRLVNAERDAERVATIYRPAVEASAASFELIAPAASEMARRMVAILARTPWLVATDEQGHVVGYAYGAQHRERPAYRWSVDVSAYVDAGWRGQGVGRQLYDELVAILRRQGFVNAFAGITLPNPASVALHEAIGMRRVGVFERVGYKLGAWHDVAWYGMVLVEPRDAPSEPIPFPDLE